MNSNYVFLGGIIPSLVLAIAAPVLVYLYGVGRNFYRKKSRLEKDEPKRSATIVVREGDQPDKIITNAKKALEKSAAQSENRSTMSIAGIILFFFGAPVSLFTILVLPLLLNRSDSGVAKKAEVVQVCLGEFAGNCPPHNLFIPCGTNEKSFAENYCSARGGLASVRRVVTYGGNACGYGLDEISCKP